MSEHRKVQQHNELTGHAALIPHDLRKIIETEVESYFIGLNMATRFTSKEHGVILNQKLFAFQ